MSRGTPGPVPIALVHHANQYVITDGYGNRQGISEIANGYARVLSLHQRYGVPASLHLSGTLLEALAWHCPALLESVASLVDDGLIGLVGGTYSECIMTLFTPEIVHRQLEELLGLYTDLLGCPPSDVRTCWVPERVWDPQLAPLLESGTLRNGGYRYVFLDDRLLFPTGGSYPRSPRARFDAAGPFGGAACSPTPEACRPYRIAGTAGLGIVPISAQMRYCVPPRKAEHLSRFQALVRALAGEPDPTLLVYADDLEKTAGVGGWEPDRGGYEAFLRWLVDHPDEQVAVRLDAWLDGQSPEERPVEAGTFYELAQLWNAGEDYRGWSEAVAWHPYGEYLAWAREAVLAATREGADERLLALAWRHLLASTHETAWQDQIVEGEPQRAPAEWAKAVASHARACLPIVAAARWAREAAPRTEAEVADIDWDGDDEVVLRGGDLFGVVTPTYGGRLVWLFHRAPEGGVLSVGNPTDHWNFQEHLNRYMEWPPNHPGALADAAHEHDIYRVAALRVSDAHAVAWLRNAHDGSTLQGGYKGFLLHANAPALLVCYQLPEGVTRFATEACLSPDYLTLLRAGRREVSQAAGHTWRGVAYRGTMAWLALSPDEETAWSCATRPEIGHGVTIRIEARSRHAHLLIGCGEPDDAQCQKLIADGRRVLCGTVPAARQKGVAQDLVVTSAGSVG